MTFTKWSNLLLLLICIIMTVILALNELVDISKFKGSLTALDAYINFTSISLGFLATVISMLTILVKQKYLGSVLNDSNARMDFIILGVISIVTGFLSVIFAVILTFVIANENVGNLVSLITSILFASSSIFYLYNLFLFILINLLSIFSLDKGN
ncbi:hypothetical protein [Staphylococcus simulans]|uniref:hypothetical protein n=1 Tax=Staphylococcus simulans TaxID=1286 RepID=UPI000D0263FA|nr:hypothetical protein [Staphylococcus simulans]PTI99150.1 hypothetical protein BU054_01400 [Staphylococcus simulans]PTJ26715.1 hypothetical protein BU030_01515 [Staphylococcus simulans]PTJ49883.1 hypothetical protein BU019_11915 [Staphylococcus simulans]RIN42668.1 hypothetical protein BU043_04310 [Staphylococcus simulans]RIN64488.1 hypothetical protein BU018_12700 [Staphylococcus simulans]